MSSAPASAGKTVLIAIQVTALGLVRPYDSEQATRFAGARVALSSNTRRAYEQRAGGMGKMGRVAGCQRAGRLFAGAGC